MEESSALPAHVENNGGMQKEPREQPSPRGQPARQKRALRPNKDFRRSLAIRGTRWSPRGPRI
eukprot:2178128-Pyramimonas_sp.AAC.1